MLRVKTDIPSPPMLHCLLKLYRAIAPEVQPRSHMSLPIANMFPEEQLTLSAEEGFGFSPAHLGILLNNSRYEI